jgi:hypothetical protein
MASGSEWVALKDIEEPERGQRMVAALNEILDQDDAKLSQSLHDLIETEYSLDDETLRAFTASRLRAWLAIFEADPARGKRLAATTDQVWGNMPATLAMRRSSMVQGVVRQQFSLEEIDRLFELIPSLVQQMPRSRVAPMQARTAHQDRRSASREGEKRPFWKFWAKG